MCYRSEDGPGLEVLCFRPQRLVLVYPQRALGQSFGGTKEKFMGARKKLGQCFLYMYMYIYIYVCTYVQDGSQEEAGRRFSVCVYVGKRCM